jgi:hypothetical protein
MRQCKLAPRQFSAAQQSDGRPLAQSEISFGAITEKGDGLLVFACSF